MLKESINFNHAFVHTNNKIKDFFIRKKKENEKIIRVHPFDFIIGWLFTG